MYLNWLSETWNRMRCGAAASRRTHHRRNGHDRRAPVQIERLEDRRLLAAYTLTNTTAGTVQYGSITLGVDGFGSFGQDLVTNGGNATDASFQPVGPGAAINTVFDSAVAIQLTSTNTPTQFLSSGFLGVGAGGRTSGGLTNPVVTGTTTEGVSTFNYGPLTFTLTQTVQPLQDPVTHLQFGSLLRQSYAVTNTGSTPISFDLFRYLDGELGTGAPALGGGGVLETPSSQELLFSTNVGGTPSTNYPEYLAVATVGGSFSTSDRFQVGAYSTVLNNILNGTPLTNTVAGDNNGDGFVDAGREYNVTEGARRSFTLAAGASSTYTTYTVWGTGVPASLNLFPTITLPSGPAAFTQNQAPVLVDPAATLIDLSSSLNGAILNVGLETNTHPDSLQDQLGIQNQGTAVGQIGVSGNTITYGGTAIATFTGGTSVTPLVFQFNSSLNVTPAMVQALMQRITFSTSGYTPPVTSETRAVDFQLLDPTFGFSNTARQFVGVVPVNAHPNVTLPTFTSYQLGGTPVQIAPTGTLTDPSTNSFALGSINVATISNAAANDQFSVNNQGTGQGQVGFSGNTVTYSGLAIATVSGGTGGTPFVVSFNTNALTFMAQAVLQNITFSNPVDNGAALMRVLTVQAVDSLGTASNLADTEVRPTAAAWFRAYDPNTGYHFFTTSYYEFQNAVNAGWSDETTNTVGFFVAGTGGADKSVIYRLYSPPFIISRQTQREERYHYYTANYAEMTFLVSNGWTLETTEGYIYQTQVPGTTEIYRLYNVRTGSHLYSDNPGVVNQVLASAPGIWQINTPLGYGFTASAFADPTSSDLPTTATQVWDNILPGGSSSGASAGELSAATVSAPDLSSSPSGVGTTGVQTPAIAVAPTSISAASVTAQDNASPAPAANDDQAGGGTVENSALDQSALDQFWQATSRNLATGTDDVLNLLTA